MSLISSRLRKLFLHYFDIQFLNLKGADRAAESTRRLIRAEARLATRFALLSAETVFLPASSFFESDLCAQIIGEFKPLYPSGQIKLVGGGESIFEFIEQKLEQYSKRSPQYKKYIEATKTPYLHPPFYSRTESATNDIAKGWRLIATEGRIRSVIGTSAFKLPKNFESEWERIPEKLGRRAFIVENVERLLLKGERPVTLRNRFYGVINDEYFRSYTGELCSGVVSDLVYLASSQVVPSFDLDLPYKALRDAAANQNLLERIQASPATELAALAGSREWKECLAIGIAQHQKRESARRAMFETINPDLNSARIGIITALPEEFAAVCEVFNSDTPVDVPGIGSGRKYALARVSTSSGEVLVVAIGYLTDMGNNSATYRATRMIEHCENIQEILMVGIAGAVPHPSKPEQHVRLGDIVVSDRNGVIQYDFDKEGPKEVEHRHPPRPPSATLIEAVKWLQASEMRNQRPWEAYIKQAQAGDRLGSEWKRPTNSLDVLNDRPQPAPPVPHPRDRQRRKGKPRIFHGPIASANKLLKNPKKRDALRNKFGVKAVEMEGSGIADASWNLERGYIVVRGTCDYCNPDKGDVWHKYAALIAAAYTRALVEVLPPLSR